MILTKRIFYIIWIGMMLSGSSIFAAEQSAKAILKHAYQYIGSLDKYTFNAVLVDDDMNNGKLLKRDRQYISAKINKPNDLRIDTKGDIKNRSIYLHNGLFTIIDHKFNYYGQIKLPQKSIDNALDYLFDKYRIKVPLAALIYSNMNKRNKFTKSTYFGKRIVASVECDYIAFRNRGGEVHVWITRGKYPLVKSFTIIDTAKKGKPRTTVFIQWNTNPNIPENDFIFKAPKGALKISIEPAN